jgi:hypothetical protein
MDGMDDQSQVDHLAGYADHRAYPNPPELAHSPKPVTQQLSVHSRMGSHITDQLANNLWDLPNMQRPIPQLEYSHQQTYVPTLPETQQHPEFRSVSPSMRPLGQGRHSPNQALSHHHSQHQHQSQQPPSKAPPCLIFCEACRQDGKDCIRSSPCDACFFEKRICVRQDWRHVPNPISDESNCRECRNNRRPCSKGLPCVPCYRRHAVCIYTARTLPSGQCVECKSRRRRFCYVSGTCDNCLESDQGCVYVHGLPSLGPACVPCQHSHQDCDRQNPCFTCEKTQEVCFYQGSVQPPPNSTAQPSPLAVSSSAMLVPNSHGLPQRVCTACSRQRKTCNGLDPCNNCENSSSICDYDKERAGSN